MKEWFIKNSDIVTVYLYTCEYQFDPEKDSNEYPFDSATISFKIYEDVPNKKFVRNKRIHIKKEHDLISEIELNMRYDMAIQFLRRLHFSHTIDDVDDITDEKGQCIFRVNEYWDTEVDTFEKCIDLNKNQSQEKDDDELPF